MVSLSKYRTYSFTINVHVHGLATPTESLQLQDN